MPPPSVVPPPPATAAAPPSWQPVLPPAGGPAGTQSAPGSVPFATAAVPPTGAKKSAGGKIVAAIILLVALGGGGYYGYTLWKAKASQPAATAVPAQQLPVSETSAPAAQQLVQSQPAATPPVQTASGASAATPAQHSAQSPANSSGSPSDTSIVGDWRGSWQNSLGQHGDSSWEVESEYGGDVRGLWDGIQFQGRRSGNIVTFDIAGGPHSCVDYAVKAKISPPGNAANFGYQAQNHCSGKKYTGTEELQLRTRLGTNASAGGPNLQASKPAKLPQSGTAAPPPAASSSQQGTASGNLQGAVLIRQVPPQYPPIAKAAKISGVVRLKVTIGTDGSVKDVSVIWGNPILAQAAVDAVRQWRYKPVLLNGKPTVAVTEASINFAAGQ